MDLVKRLGKMALIIVVTIDTVKNKGKEHLLGVIMPDM
jgi:hypothetical protein